VSELLFFIAGSVADWGVASASKFFALRQELNECLNLEEKGPSRRGLDPRVEGLNS
jgi:hypothetical protein